MKKLNCLKNIRNISFFALIFFVLVVSFSFLLSDMSLANTSDNISLQGKIVRNDTGYEGLNVVNGSPACVKAGQDDCGFRVNYYSASTGGTLYYSEIFFNVEIGDTRGVFNLKLGSGSSNGGAESSLEDVLLKYSNVFVEIAFDPTGVGTFSEVFTRTALNASAYAIRSKYAEGSVADSFQFHTASSATGLTSQAGSVYYDTSENVLKVYNGSTWVDIGGAGATAWASEDISIFSYAQYMESSGIGTLSPFSLDLDDKRMSLNVDTQRGGLSVFSSYGGANAWPLVSFKADSLNFSSTILELVQDGSGSILTGYSGSTLTFEFDNLGDLHLANNGILYFEPFSSLPSSGSLNPKSGEGCMYSYGGDLYWDPSCDGSANALVSGSGSLWTDAGTYTYLTSTTDSLALGGSTPETSKFFFDMNTGRLGIGTDTPQAALDIGGVSSSISNTTGDITIDPAENLSILGNVKLGDGTTTKSLYAYNMAETYYGQIELYNLATGSMTLRTTFDTGDIVLLPGISGNVGIGTSDPQQQLHLTESIRLEDTTSSSIGVIYKGTHSFIHNFSHPTGDTAVPIGRNTFVGVDAGNFTMGSTATSIHDSSYNVGLGFASLSANTTGYANVAVGDSALLLNTEGGGNVATGFHALFSNTIGDTNVAVGSFSLTSNTTGSYNVAVGRNALGTNLSGHSNVAIGRDAGRYLSDGLTSRETGNFGVYIGRHSRASAQDTINEVVIGYDAIGLGSNTVVLGNTNILTTALRGNVGIGTSSPDFKLDVDGIINTSETGGYYQDGERVIRIAKGTETFYGSTHAGVAAGSNANLQSVFGHQAGMDNIGWGQTAVGFQAGMNNTMDSVSVLGLQAGMDNTGWGLTAMGQKAGLGNEGDSTSLFGYEAGMNNLGWGLTAVGRGAGIDNLADSVSVLGYEAGMNNVGWGLTAIGDRAGSGNQGHSGTFLGYQAGMGNLGDNVIAIGHQAGMNNVLDHQFIVQQSHVNVVPLIQGDFSTGRVGIGTTDPSATLSVNGSIAGGESISTASNNFTFGVGITNDISNSFLVGFGSTSFFMDSSQSRFEGLLTIMDTYGEGGGGIRYSESSQRLELSRDGTTWTGVGTSERSVTLSAEYPGAVLAADGSDNTGWMIADAEGTAANSMNYYQWISTETNLQDYDVRIRYTLPSDFVSWDSNALIFYYSTESDSSANSKTDIYVYEQTSSVVDASSTDNVSSTGGDWETTTISGSSLTDCNSAGDTCIFIIRMYSRNDFYTRVGDIKINYNREL